MQRLQLQCVLAIAPLSILLIQSAGAVEVPETNTGVQLEEFSRRATTVKDWFAQIKQTENSTAVQVTKVQINRTDTGLEIILETLYGKPLQIDTEQFTTEGNTLIANIPNAVLKLAEGNEFSTNNPTADISRISINQIANNRIQIAVVGTNQIPTNVTLRTGELAYNLRPMGETRNVEIVVTRTPRSAYVAPIATTGTRTDTPLRDVPQSIQVIPRQVLQDQQITQIGDALRNVSGVSRATPSASFFGDFVNIRGFAIGRDYFVNGIRMPFAAYNIDLDPLNVEQIEVLKGPASVLYGQGEPGGIINLTSKQPLDRPYYNLGATIGNFNFYRPNIDLSGPLDSDKRVLYRLNAAYQSSDTFVDYTELERYAIAPVISFQLGESTKLTIEGLYQQSYAVASFSPLPALGTVLSNPLGDIPRSRYIGDPEVERPSYRPTGNIGYRFEHRFSENWSVRNAFRYDFLNVNEDYVSPGSLEADNRTLPRTLYRERNRNADNYNVQTDVIGKIETGVITQDLLLGFELRRGTVESKVYNAPLPPLDIFNPVYGVPSPSDSDLTLDSNYFLEQNFVGFYAQDLISIRFLQ